MKPTGKFSYSFYPDIHYSCEYNSVEEALEDARTDKKYLQCYREKKTVYIGKVCKFEPKVFSDIVVERIQEDAYDEAGEIAEDYLMYTSQKDMSKLNEMLTETFNKWAKETGNEPNFFTVEEIQEYSLEDSDHAH